MRSGMITRESDYAIRVIDYLRRESTDEKVVSVKQIADAVLIPYRFARKIIGQLADAEILLSVRGKNGGVKINKVHSEITAFDVVSVIDPKSLILNRCIAEPGSCVRSGECAVHQKLLGAQKEFENLFKSMKL